MDSDYIKTLSDEEKLVFVKLFCKLIKSDGVIDEAEISFLKTIAAHYEVDNSIMSDIVKHVGSINCIEEASKITNRQHALELIKELCVVANIDNSLEDAELDVILEIADAMGVKDKVVVINRWVLDSLILNEAGRIIMEKDNG